MTAVSAPMPMRSLYPNEHDMCPACSQYGLAVIDDRGPLVTHAGRNFPCRPVFEPSGPDSAAQWLRGLFEAQQDNRPLTAEQLAEIRSKLVADDAEPSSA